MMDATTRTHYDNLSAADGTVRYAAYTAILATTEQSVDWAYEVWDELVARLYHENNHQRSIAAQLLCNLVKSDPKQRILNDFDALLNATRDKMFVTARHSLQALWKIGTAGIPQREMLVAGLTHRFADCRGEKNCTLIRSDIVQGLRQLFEAVQDEAIRERALTLIATEEDEKYRKKYASIWKKA